MGGDAMFSGTFLKRISTWKGEFLIGKSWDSQEGFERRDFHRSRTEAQWFLQDLLSDSFAVMTLRDVLGGTETTLDLSRLSDHDVVDRLASKIASGRLAVFERSRFTRRKERPDEKPLLEERPSSMPQWEPEPVIWGAGGGTPAVSPPSQPAKKPEPVREQPKPVAKVLSVQWNTAEAYCSDNVTVSGTTLEYQDGSKVQVDLKKRGGGVLTSKQIAVKGDAFQATWQLTEILPEKVAGHILKEMELDAVAGGQVSPKPLKVRFIPEAKKLRHQSRWGAFFLSVDDHEALVEAELNYVQGWAGEVVDLANTASAGAGGLIVAFILPGYRWMKTLAGVRHFWDGAAWTPLPPGFTVDDKNHFSVGFYKTGNLYISQYGGEWPDPVSPWDISLEVHQSKIRTWANAIEETWTDQFDMRNANCKSAAYPCCRYRVKVKAQFNEKPIYTSGILIIVKDNARSNNALWSLAATRRSMPVHEFGHHLDNVDEYRGATSLDRSMNGDGAVNGVDADSIMGTGMTKVKERHLAAIRRHMASVVRAENGKSYTYKAVRP